MPMRANIAAAGATWWRVRENVIENPDEHEHETSMRELPEELNSEPVEELRQIDI